MTDKFSLACILWDQKLGGVLQRAKPYMQVSDKTAMNLYNMHRVTNVNPAFGTIKVKLESGDQFNVCSFFTGYGGSTSPDGFTANYGKNIIGVAERVICLFLTPDVRAEDYEEVLAKIGSRIVIDVAGMNQRIDVIGDLIAKIDLIKKPDKLFEYLEKYLDSSLGLNAELNAVARFHEVKALHYMLLDKKEHIKELTINPAKTAFVRDQQKIAETEEQKKQIQLLIQQITELSMQKSMVEMNDSEKDDVISTLKSDYIKIFGTLTEQIQSLQDELNGITESTQGLVNDLNVALREKIKKVQDLDAELKSLKSQKPKF
jgi:hypothetical protein